MGQIPWGTNGHLLSMIAFGCYVSVSDLQQSFFHPFPLGTHPHVMSASGTQSRPLRGVARGVSDLDGSQMLKP